MEGGLAGLTRVEWGIENMWYTARYRSRFCKNCLPRCV